MIHKLFSLIKKLLIIHSNLIIILHDKIYILFLMLNLLYLFYINIYPLQHFLFVAKFQMLITQASLLLFTCYLAGINTENNCRAPAGSL